MTNFAPYGIGTTAAGILSLDDLGIPTPKAEAVDYAAYVENGDGALVGQGWLRCAWRFAFLDVTNMTTLLAYVGNCYIRTLKEDGTYGTYSALMLQPQKRSPKVKSQMDYVIEFRWLVAV